MPLKLHRNYLLIGLQINLYFSIAPAYRNNYRKLGAHLQNLQILHGILKIMNNEQKRRDINNYMYF